MEYKNEMTDAEFVQWAKEHSILVTNAQFFRAIAEAAYENGYSKGYDSGYDSGYYNGYESGTFRL